MSEAKAAEPVRIKMYGLFPTTKRRYVAQVVVAAVMIVFSLVVWLVLRRDVDRLRGINSPQIDLFVSLWRLLPWVVGGVAVLQVIEAFFAFRAFRRKRAAAAAAQPPAQS